MVILIVVSLFMNITAFRVTIISECLENSGDVFRYTGLSLQSCSTLCAQRPWCKLLSYHRRMQLCSLYQEDSVLDEENQNDGSQPASCVYIKRGDQSETDVERCDAQCPSVGQQLQVCEDNACVDQDCFPENTISNGRLVGNVNTEGGVKSLKCDATYWPRNEVKRTVCAYGHWTPLLHCDTVLPTTTSAPSTTTSTTTTTASATSTTSSTTPTTSRSTSPTESTTPTTAPTTPTTAPTTSTTASTTITTTLTTTSTSPSTTSTSTTSSTTTTTPLPTTTTPMAQWVDSVLSFSSQWRSNGQNSAYRVNGASDVYPAYGDIPQAWAPSWEGSNEFLELMYLTSVHVTGIDIYETHLGGAVSAVKCYQNGGYTTLWTSPSIERITVARIFQPQLATGCFSNRVKLEIAAITGWVNIDAVQLHGYI